VSDALFPSGPWIGFYKYSRSNPKYRMDLHLTFANGNMSGIGRDNVGRFLIRGRYDARNRECHWTKSYLGAHDVFYRGFREGKGIWGLWEIGSLSRGGFHIWPLQSGADEAESLTTEEAQPIEAIGVEGVANNSQSFVTFVTKDCIAVGPRILLIAEVLANNHT
jgi:hypothetical protein